MRPIDLREGDEIEISEADCWNSIGTLRLKLTKAVTAVPLGIEWIGVHGVQKDGKARSVLVRAEALLRARPLPK